MSLVTFMVTQTHRDLKMKHSLNDCSVKCDALKKILTDIQIEAGAKNDYDIRHKAESALDLIRELKGEFSGEEK